MQKKTSRTRNTNLRSSVRITIGNDTTASMSRKDLGKMTTYSGTASDGAEVHSLSAKQVGKSTVIRDGQGNLFSFLTNDLEVLAAGLFPDIGKVKVTAK